MNVLVELVFRGAVFALTFPLLALGEWRRPLRPAAAGKVRRDGDNLLLLVLGIVCARLVLPTGAVGVAFAVQQQGFGILHLVHARLSVACAVTLVVLDAAVYGQHVLMHAWGPLWRLHRVHHSDTDLDLTTGLRFHPGEILISAGFKVGVVAALGAPPVAVLAFEALLNASSLFNHSNFALPAGLERAIRTVVVTPDMHWIHHSIVPAETRRNFGFCLSVWDRLFATYQHAPAAGYQRMELGIDGTREAARGIGKLLLQPLAPVTAGPGRDYRIRLD